MASFPHEFSLSMGHRSGPYRSSSFAQELGKREKRKKGEGGGGGRERGNKPAGMTFKQHLQYAHLSKCDQNSFEVQYHADIAP